MQATWPRPGEIVKARCERSFGRLVETNSRGQPSQVEFNRGGIRAGNIVAEFGIALTIGLLVVSAGNDRIVRPNGIDRQDRLIKLNLSLRPTPFFLDIPCSTYRGN